MSMAKKCDRCGICFDPYTETDEFGRIGYFVTMNGDNFANHEVQYRDDEIDLCPWCLSGFKQFLTGRPVIIMGTVSKKSQKKHSP